MEISNVTNKILGWVHNDDGTSDFYIEEDGKEVCFKNAWMTNYSWGDINPETIETKSVIAITPTKIVQGTKTPIQVNGQTIGIVQDFKLTTGTDKFKKVDRLGPFKFEVEEL